jgi:hypothetical protein
MSGKNKKQEKYLNIFVSVGAAVVIFGAWSKILHLEFADIMLTVGLLTEAAIFLVYAFIPPHNDMEEIAEALKGAILVVETVLLNLWTRCLQKQVLMSQ